MAKIQPKIRGDEHDDGFHEKMIAVNRVTKVIKGSRILGFAVLTVVGDGDDRIDMGRGKVKEVPVAVQKTMDEAHRKMVKVPLGDDTLQYEVVSRHGAAKVQMMPAKDGTGVITGGPVHAIFEVMGVTSIMTKSHGSTNPYNMAHATLDDLCRISIPAGVAAERGKSVEEILG